MTAGRTPFASGARGGAGRPSLAEELKAIAGDVRRIGCAFRADPEAILMQKDAIARRLVELARRVPAAA